MKTQTFKLPNGLRVMFVDTEAFPTLTTLILVGAGSRYENEKNNGIAHFFEHMAFKGSKKYLNSYVITSTIEGMGGIFNAFTSKDHTGYWIKATSEHFETIIDVLSDMILHPLLLEEEISREKGVIVEELNMYEDNPMQKVPEIFEELLYKGNPLGMDIGGKKETVMNFTKKTFVDYMNDLYRPNNVVLVVAGGFGKNGKKTTEKYLKIVKDRMGDWKKGSTASFIPIVEKQTKPQMLLKQKKTEQTHFTLGFRAYSMGDKRKYATSVLATILGGGMSSKLFIEVRERRGLCYYISSGREMYHDTGNFVTRAGVTNSLEKTKEAIEVILQEHTKVANGEIDDDQLERAKEIIKGRTLLSMEDSHNVANYFGVKYLLENEVADPAKVIAEIQKVTKEQVLEVAKDLFRPEKLNLAMVGPFDKKEEFEKVLKI